MPNIIGLKELEIKLKKLQSVHTTENPRVIVGYTQNYAIYVHENLEAHHPVGQAKYLEQPARALQRELGEIVVKAFKSTKNLEMALLVAGLRLQRASQELVPVDTGALKNSAFTAKEKDAAQEAAAAHARATVIRERALTKFKKKKGRK